MPNFGQKGDSSILRFGQKGVGLKKFAAKLVVVNKKKPVDKNKEHKNPLEK
jgi:hypothetical protein